jgi:small-conductance mechanosensitive channel
MRSREPRQQTPRALRSLGQEWEVDKATLGSWMETTSHRLDALTAAREEIRVLDDRWTKTETKLVADAAPAELADRVRGVLESVRETEARIDKEIDKLLLLQSRISEARLDTEEALDTIAAALSEGRSKLLQIDSPPIWRLFARVPPREPVSREMSAAFAEARRALTQYSGRARQRLWSELILFILLVVVFYRLRPASRAWPLDDRGLKACARLVRWPVLGAALVALLCGLWMNPRAPLIFYELSSILLVLPVVVVLRGIVRPELRASLTAVAGIFVVERVWETTWAGSILERLVLLGLTVLSGAVLVWVLRPRTPFPEPVAQRWWRVVTVAGRFALAALAVSLASSVIGNVSLARLLTATVVRAGYAGIVLYAANLLLRGAAALLIGWAAAHSFHAIERNGELLMRRASLVIDALAIALFAFFVLTAATLLPVLRETVVGTITKPWGIGELRFSIASVLLFIAAVWASIVISRLIRGVLEEDVYPRVELPRGVPGAVTMLVGYGVLSLGFLLALSIAGIPLDRLAFVLGALGVGIGFGLQNVVNDFVSGMILMFERPIQIGDAVEVSGLVGRVKRIGARSSTVETFDGAEVIVPNGSLVSSQLVNWTLESRSRRVEVELRIARDVDPEKVLAVLREATTGQEGVLAEPEPTAIVRAISADSLDCSVRFWTSDFEGWMTVRSAATVKINRALAEAGIALASDPTS